MKRFRLIWPNDSDFTGSTERNNFVNDPRPDFVDADYYEAEYNEHNGNFKGIRFYIDDEEVLFMSYLPFSIRTEEIPVVHG